VRIQGGASAGIICALRKTALAAAKSVMSSRSRSAGDIIANSTATVMNQRGGRNQELIQPVLRGRFG
jgi:hypothetical protein